MAIPVPLLRSIVPRKITRPSGRIVLEARKGIVFHDSVLVFVCLFVGSSKKHLQCHVRLEENHVQAQKRVDGQMTSLGATVFARDQLLSARLTDIIIR